MGEKCAGIVCRDREVCRERSCRKNRNKVWQELTRNIIERISISNSYKTDYFPPVDILGPSVGNLIFFHSASYIPLDMLHLK